MSIRAASRATPGPSRRVAYALAAPFLAAPFLVGAAGCSRGAVVVRGTGEIVQEQRVLRATEGLSLDGDLDVSVRVVRAQGAQRDTLVWIEGASDLLEYVEAVVEGSVLRVRYRDGVRLDPVPTIEVQATRLERLSASGSGSVRIEGLGVGLRPGVACRIDVAGSVDVRAAGDVERLVVRQVGASDLHLEGVVALDIDHSSVGSGDAWLRATRLVETSIAGSGDVHVYGDPTVEDSILGSGDVVLVHRAPGDGR